MSKTTTPATITLKTGRIGGSIAEGPARDRLSEIAVGDFMSETLVTDSVVYEVVKITAKTVTLRTTSRGEKFQEDTACDKGGHGLSVVWEEQVSNPEGATYSLRVRKDGSIRMGSHAGSRPLYPSATIDGKPARRVDYRV